MWLVALMYKTNHQEVLENLQVSISKDLMHLMYQLFHHLQDTAQLETLYQYQNLQAIQQLVKQIKT